MAAAAPSALKGVASLASSAGNKSGSASASPEQAALAQYQYGQNLLATQSGAANKGIGASTMATQAAGGAANQYAAQMAGAADLNTQAQQQATSQLQQLAQQQAGSGAQAQGISDTFGNTGGNFGTS